MELLASEADDRAVSTFPSDFPSLRLSWPLTSTPSLIDCTATVVAAVAVVAVAVAVAFLSLLEVCGARIFSSADPDSTPAPAPASDAENLTL